MRTADLVGTCQQDHAQPGPGEVSLWESRRGREDRAAARERHLHARLECHNCPLLEACEQALSDMEREGKSVDGVMAARYSDKKSHVNSIEEHQSHCRGCQERLWPQWKANEPIPVGRVQHLGEGLCTTCYPALSRAAIHHHTMRKAS